MSTTVGPGGTGRFGSGEQDSGVACAGALADGVVGGPDADLGGGEDRAVGGLVEAAWSRRSASVAVCSAVSGRTTACACSCRDDWTSSWIWVLVQSASSRSEDASASARLTVVAPASARRWMKWSLAEG